MFEDIKKLYQNKEVRALLILGSLSLFFCGLNLCQKKENLSKEPIVKKSPQESVDTVIPAGFSLVPIEIVNSETLDSILGSFGVVNLHTVPMVPGGMAKRIAYRVKIIRSPRKPNQFAILVPHEKIETILRHPGPYAVSVQNPKSSGTVFVEEKRASTKKRSRISYNLSEE